jgi:hypothetical protein
MRELAVGNTRKDKCIDRVFVNFKKLVKTCGSLAPLQPNEDRVGSDSDHRVVFAKAALPTKEKGQWLSYSSRKFTKKKAEKFKEWLVNKDWKDLLEADGSNRKADIYQKSMEWAMNEFFPYTRTKRRSTEDPWVNDRIRSEKN